MTMMTKHWSFKRPVHGKTQQIILTMQPHNTEKYMISTEAVRTYHVVGCRETYFHHRVYKEEVDVDGRKFWFQINNDELANYIRGFALFSLMEHVEETE